MSSDGHAAAITSAAVFLLVILLSGFCLITEYDVGWYLASGEEILRTGSLPAQDSFTYTADLPWQNHMWLTHLIVALSYRAGGMLGVTLWQALLLALTIVALMWGHAARGVITKRTAEPVVGLSLAGYAVGAMLLREILSPRGQTAADLCFAITLALALRDMTVCEGARPRKLLYLTLPCGLLWTQLHGGNPAGFILLSLLFVSGPSLRRAAYAAAAAALTCAGPYGIKIHAHLFGGYGAMPAFSEWLPLHTALSRSFWPHIPYVLFVGLAAWALLRRLRRGDERAAVRFLLLALATFTAAAVAHIRFLHEATIVAIAALAPALADCQPRPGWLRARVAGPALAIALMLAVLPISSRVAGVGLAPWRFPIDAVAFLRRTNPAGPMFNSANYGGYLAWRFPQQKVFIDGRALIIARPALLRSLLAVYDAPPRFKQLQRRYGFRLAVLQRRGRGARLLAWLRRQPRWRVVHEDRVAAVLIRASADRK